MARTRGLVLGLRARVMEGASLAEAMADHPRSFPELYRASVAAGERSGKLDGVLGLLADEAESRDAMRQSIWAALAYPLLLAMVAILVVSGLLIYVVPQIAEVFVRMHQDLPWSTRALLAGSAFLRAYGIWLLLLLIGVAAGIRCCCGARSGASVATPGCCACRVWDACSRWPVRPAPPAPWRCSLPAPCRCWKR